jgi:hypothetical protein
LATRLPSAASRWRRPDSPASSAAPSWTETLAEKLQIKPGSRVSSPPTRIWHRVAELGWALNGNVAVDEAWSAVRIKRTG